MVNGFGARLLSMGEIVVQSQLNENDWYWLEEKDKKSIYVYAGKAEAGSYRFVHADSGVDRPISLNELGGMKCRKYIPLFSCSVDKEFPDSLL